MVHLMLPLADVGTALTAIAKMFAGYLAAALGLALVFAGYTYMFALEDHSKATQAKRAIGAILAGAIVVAVGVGIAIKITQAIGN